MAAANATTIEDLFGVAPDVFWALSAKERKRRAFLGRAMVEFYISTRIADDVSAGDATNFINRHRGSAPVRGFLQSFADYEAFVPRSLNKGLCDMFHALMQTAAMRDRHVACIARYILHVARRQPQAGPADTSSAAERSTNT